MRDKTKTCTRMKATRRHRSGANGRWGPGGKRDRFVGLVLFLPLAVIVLALTVIPVYWVLESSLHTQRLFSTERTFVYTQNYRSVLSDPGLRRAIRNSLVFASGSLLIQVPIAVLLAQLLHKRFFLRNFVRGSILFTFLIPYVVVALTFRFMLSEATGIINYWIRQSGLPIAPTVFGSTRSAMLGVIIVNSWKNFPIVLIVVLSAMQAIGEELYEAAQVAGATAWGKFRHITLPLILPALSSITLLRFIWNFNNFEVVHLLTQGGPMRATETLPLIIFRAVFGEFNLGRGSSLAVLGLSILIACTILYWRYSEYIRRRWS